ncbi:MAG TPA: MoaD/ThiS family protein [Anaerolineae bacterium]|nr:MoaD/ThiS family protein [Anaerolineae bacterium]
MQRRHISDQFVVLERGCLMAAVEVRIPPQIARELGAQRWESIDADTVAGMVEALDLRYPGIAAQLLTPEGTPRAWINIFIDERDIRSLDGMATKLRPDLKVYIVPAIGGG